MFTLKAELHCHSNTQKTRLPYAPFLFDSTLTVEEILRKAIELDIRILAITDHDSLGGYRRAKELLKGKKLPLILVPGCEVSTKEGDILAYNIKSEIKKNLPAKDAIDQIHKQGGIAVAAHPFIVFSLQQEVSNLKFDAIEVYNSAIPLIAVLNAFMAAKELNLPALAGSDAHVIETMGGLTIFFPSDTKSINDVVRNIKKGNFGIHFQKTDVLKMIKELVVRNVGMQMHHFK